MLLLDTCTLLWLTSDPGRLSERARAQIESNPTKLRASSITAFEIGQKAVRGRLQLPLDLQTWWTRVMETHGLIELPVTGAIAAAATLLPPLHRDPFDRILIATAQIHDLSLVTPDLLISQYPKGKPIW